MKYRAFCKGRGFPRPLLLPLLLWGCLWLVSCEYDLQRFFFRDPPPDQRSSELQDVASPPLKGEKLDFMILTDLHFGSDNYMATTELRASLAGRKLDFIVLLGDVVDTGFEEYFRECEDFIRQLRSWLSLPALPVYVVLGNHDLYQNGYDGWQKLSFNAANGSTFFRFETTISAGGRKFSRSWYFLDTASGILGQSQMNALERAMSSDPNPKIVFTHYPVYADMPFFAYFKLSDDRERARLIFLFDRYGVDMVFSGHWHTGSWFDYGSFSELCCSSFIENSDKTSSWFFLSLDEAQSQLSVERYKAFQGKTASEISMYPLRGGA